MSDQQFSLTDGLSEPCPHGVDLHYFICTVCGNTPDQTIATTRERTYTRTFTEREQQVLTNALLAYRRGAIFNPDELDVVDGIIRDGWSS
jgi:hypothetical protein